MNILVFFPILFMLLLGIAAEVLLGLWTYRDAKARGLNAVLWTLVVLLVPSFIGLIVYLVAGRNQFTGLCPNCSSAVQANVKFCPNCGGTLGTAADGSGPSPRPLPKTGKGLLIGFIVCIVLMVLGIVAYVPLTMIMYNTRSGIDMGKEMLIDSNISFGSVENHTNRQWHMSFMSLNGRKESDQLKYDGSSPATVHVESSLGSGKLTLELTQGDIRSALDLSSPQSVSDIDLSIFKPGAIHMEIVAEDARDGTVDISWD